jgi:hypothetical protein|tara:strand:- start:151 stop:549 length:399 start_codon:yes stop_codon:yes gene_type:complete
MELPSEVTNYILDYIRTDIGIINKYDYKKKLEIYNKKSDIIKKWYNKYKIESRMPILFLDEMENFDKWYIIRLYMKFYPKPDLYDWPLYYLKRTKILTGQEDIMNYKYTKSAYSVFKFMNKINKNDIIKTGF